MIQVLNRALDILELIAQNQKTDLTLSEIANKCNLNHGTCANIIKTMISRHYISQPTKRKGYKLGPMAYNLTGNYSDQKELILAAKEAMTKLTKLLNEGTILAIKRDNTRVIINEEKAHNELQVVNYPEKPMYDTSTGRLLLAYMNENELQDYIKKFGLPESQIWNEVSDDETLKMEFLKIKEKRICIQISVHHITGIAVPIWRKEKVVASLGVYLPEFRLKESNREFIIENLKRTANEINNILSTQLNKN